MLKIDALNQYYGGSHILRNVNLAAEDGKLTVLLGRNGVGKSTLLRCLMGVVAAKSGSVSWRGTPLGALPPYARVAAGLAYVPQGRDIFPRLTVEENLLVGAASRKARSSVPDRIYELFPVLKDMRARRGGDLSGGQQQQLAIGRALMSEPQLLILDEPTEGIQPSIIQDIGRTLRQLVDESKMTVLLVEQYYDFARSIADHYWVMSRGEVVAGGDARDMEANGVRELIAV
ncbi:urea ABC transporter, ATP-binding protein UrtE [Burkholderia ambifaria AMMD]|uniref:Amino acid/amide ABC transporter ATP-binding protein 2, HAAT family n=1 Tax=Burkholderia ambifaria (strain ATCC BAA-244 / DSM 16087 / CCUG 44356 / LMG 19182 / AMMD) TaxID=339670 RepID=Q0BHN1_BURCM|nr:urea ABC transporter ATP-binding subunit UrtE [Burkholderia ambifaria]ABI86342.1 amino acid/amide ABC transporter ATP-binding protein 2, HAAT family [Burkholderia ambifaria AMMD]AJY20805.1 urea ABC transporter, ATP-binding protein UrtE [Burkholderia ambifaria AMMD]MBR7934406.1 urea ABC transporter ATP-binding subunit UrtE [Burkholderia ambifaria]PEH66360.1 urea ABC transporter ATP-binding subunit UrtE [Burkholderia ambifaria]QQC03323.1 urea ABC transporter ATP-binding subunit UrtE [Burkhold